ncbi:BatD family protein [Tautonia marina]|uniref:BatD family protein n=1 Tax=Tautonia marina TaxID=2653855 RepID=UPI00137633CF|nr:BatD family protein [Tautonia marina]
MFWLTAWVLTLVLGSGAFASQEGRLPVRFEQVPEGPHYLGQAIPVRLLVTAAEELPVIDLPEVDQVDLILVGSDVRPITAGAIGTMVHETNLYRFDLLLVPRASGNVLVPAIRARVGDRQGASRPIRLNAIVPPAYGRPPWFLGGVGPLELELIAQPEAIRLGESSLVSVRIKGQGAFGSTVRPTLRGPDGGTLPAEIEPETSLLDVAAPARTVTDRVRPTEAGTLRLAPVLVAWFDPETRRYQTVSSTSVSIRVEDPPRFDPAMIEVATLEEEEPRAIRNDWSRWITGIGMVGVGLFLTVITGRTVRRWNRSPHRLAVRAARRIHSLEGVTRADLAVGAVVGFLHLAMGRPEGALTPPEAREAIETLTRNLSLADRVGEMVEACDAIRYSGRRIDGEDRRRPLDEAPAILNALAHARLYEARPDTGRPATGHNEPSV